MQGRTIRTNEVQESAFGEPLFKPKPKPKQLLRKFEEHACLCFPCLPQMSQLRGKQIIKSKFCGPVLFKSLFYSLRVQTDPNRSQFPLRDSHERLERYSRAFIYQFRSSFLVETLYPSFHHEDCNFPPCNGHLHICPDCTGVPLAVFSSISRVFELVEALLGVCRIRCGGHGRGLGVWGIGREDQGPRASIYTYALLFQRR